MSATVYYFSGTGNSQAIAGSISEGLAGRLVSIASVIDNKEINTDSDSIGIVFPVYYADIPNIVRKFIPKLTGLSTKYVFVVCNYGGGAGFSLRTAKKLIVENGGELAASYGIHMPQNAFRKPWENAEKLYVEADAEIKRICSLTLNKTKVRMARREPLELLLMPFGHLLNSHVRNYFIKTVNGSKDETNADMIYRLDCTFGVNENCAGCGICSKVCPVRNIVMENGKPKWTHHCENCLACYNLCPKKAVVSGIAQKGRYYLKPGYDAKKAAEQPNGACNSN